MLGWERILAQCVVVLSGARLGIFRVYDCIQRKYDLIARHDRRTGSSSNAGFWFLPCSLSNGLSTTVTPIPGAQTGKQGSLNHGKCFSDFSSLSEDDCGFFRGSPRALRLYITLLQSNVNFRNLMWRKILLLVEWGLKGSEGSESELTKDSDRQDNKGR